MSLIKTVIMLFFLIFVVSCNKNLTEEERKELWSKAQTSGEIINRSGTVFSSANNKDLAMRDAENKTVNRGWAFWK